MSLKSSLPQSQIRAPTRKTRNVFQCEVLFKKWTSKFIPVYNIQPEKLLISYLSKCFSTDPHSFSNIKRSQALAEYYRIIMPCLVKGESTYYITPWVSKH